MHTMHMEQALKEIDLAIAMFKDHPTLATMAACIRALINYAMLVNPLDQ